MQINVYKETVFFKDDGFEFVVVFNRTIRLPEDGKVHALPPSLGPFPIHLVDDFKDKVPPEWVEHGGVFLPVHPREAMWLRFSGSTAAVKVAAGMINAVSGKPWDPKLIAGEGDVQDYMVAPSPQTWLDGFNTGAGVIKQFVGMALGMGYTVEGQITGEEKFGGIQLLVVPPKPGKILERLKGVMRGMTLGDNEFNFSSMDGMKSCNGYSAPSVMRSYQPQTRLTKGAQVGLAAGGEMKQKIYPDPHGLDTWDQDKTGRLYVHMINAEMYQQITGKMPPALPQSAQDYLKANGAWFDLADGQMGDVTASKELAGVKTVAGKDKEHGFEGQQDDSPVEEKNVMTYPMPAGSVPVRNGKW